MSDSRNGRTKLRVISGGRDTALRIGKIPVCVAPGDDPPFAIDALLCEEDRFLVMGAADDLEAPSEHPLRIINQAWAQEPLSVGSLQVRAGAPLRYLAVVHDLDRAPSCRPIWILSALAALKQQLLTDTRVRSLAMPLLGVRHGPLEVTEALDLLLQVMEGERWALDRIWLQVPQTDRQAVVRLLKDAL